MAKIDKSKWPGSALFEYYTSQPGEYKGTLFEAFMLIGDKLYTMLEKAEAEGKKIVIMEDIEGVMDPPSTVVVK